MLDKRDYFKSFGEFLDYLSGLLVLMIVAIMFINILLRYTTGEGIVWTYEICQMFIILWITFLGSGVAVLNRDHIRVEALDKILPPKICWTVDFVRNLLTIAFLVFFIYSSILMIRISTDYTDLLRAPRKLVYVPLLVGASLMLLFIGYRIIRGDKKLQVGGRA
jgi:TRAP-type C4-dicarboxylate transport system permease small subunit